MEFLCFYKASKSILAIVEDKTMRGREFIIKDNLDLESNLNF